MQHEGTDNGKRQTSERASVSTGIGIWRGRKEKALAYDWESEPQKGTLKG